VREQRLFGSALLERAPKHSVGDAVEEEESPIVHKVRIYARIQCMNIESNWGLGFAERRKCGTV
jgi:hypothetical protein